MQALTLTQLRIAIAAIGHDKDSNSQWVILPELQTAEAFLTGLDACSMTPWSKKTDGIPRDPRDLLESVGYEW